MSYDARPALYDGLTDRQSEFARGVAKGLKPGEAATAAGYDDGVRAAHRLMRVPRILLAVRTELARVIGTELPALALVAVQRVLADPGAKNSDIIAAARLAFEAARFIGRGAVGDPLHNADDKPIEQMSQAELEAFVAGGKQAVGALRADRTIEGQAADNLMPEQGAAIRDMDPA